MGKLHAFEISNSGNLSAEPESRSALRAAKVYLDGEALLFCQPKN
jgi:hypothetical protein